MSNMVDFDIFMERVSSVILDVLMNKEEGFDDIFPFYSVSLKPNEERRYTDEDALIIERFKEQESLYSSFISSLTPTMHREYMRMQEDVYNLHLDMGKAC